MSLSQSMVMAILAATFGLIAWGRWRHDVIAFGALIVSVVVGVVPSETAFMGFAHPATVTVAAVLIQPRADEFRRGGSDRAKYFAERPKSPRPPGRDLWWRGPVFRLHEQRGRPCLDIARRLAGGRETEAFSGFAADAARFRLDSRRVDYPDWHAAQCDRRNLPGGGFWDPRSKCSILRRWACPWPWSGSPLSLFSGGD